MMYRNTMQIALALTLVGISPGVATAGKQDVGLLDPGVLFDTIHQPKTDERITERFIVVSEGATSYISGGITQAYQFCAGLSQKEYTVDCLRERIDALTRTLPDTGDYAEAKQVLQEATSKLAGVVARNRAPSKPRGRARGQVNGTPVVTAPLTPVRTEAVKPSIEQAVAILDEASTKLLRSAANSEARKVHYQDIAQAVGSNKILLRSA